MGVDIGLFSADAGGDLQAVAKKGAVGAEIAGGNDFLHAVGVVGLVGVVGGRAAGPVIGIRLVTLPEFAVVHVLLLGEAKIGDARRVDVVEKRHGAVVVDQAGLRGGRGASAAVGADVIIKFARSAAAVAEDGADIEAAFERDGDAADHEIAAGVAVGLAAGLVGFLANAVGRNNGVAAKIGGIDAFAVGIGDRDRARAEIENIVEADRHVGAAADEAVKSAVVDVLVMNARGGIGNAGF